MDAYLGITSPWHTVLLPEVLISPRDALPGVITPLVGPLDVVGVHIWVPSIVEPLVVCP